MVATAYGSADKLPLTGGTLTGTLILTGAPALQIPAGAAAGKVPTSDGAGNLTLQSPAFPNIDWINAKSAVYGAKGDGVTDDTTAINAALAAANTQGGGTVYLPWGTYLVSATISIPPYTFLVGQTQISLNQFTTPGGISRIVAAASWAPGSSTGIVSVLSKTPGAWAVNTAACGLRNVFIDGSLNANTNLQGINMIGPVYDVHLDDVLIWKAPHHGVTSSTQTESGIGPTSPYHHRYSRVSAVGCGSAGFNIVNYTDSTLENCLAFGNVSDGYSLQNNSSSTLAACRAEWSSGGRGFDITGSAGSVVLSGCSTDQNFSEGLRIHAATGQSTQGGGIVVSGGKFHADGNGGTNNNGIKITGSTVPVTITGVNVESGQNANNSNYCPNLALEIDTSSNVVVAGSIFQGITTPWSDGGGNSNLTRTSCFGLSGNPNTQTLVPLADFASGLTIGSVVPLGDNGAGELQLANAGTIPTTNPTGGLDLYSSAGQLKSRNPQGLVQSVSSLVQATTSTTTVTGVTAETVLQTFTVPANDPAAGAVYHVTGYGTFTAASGNLQWTVRWGGVAGTVIAQLPVNAAPVLTNGLFWYDVMITFRSTTSCTTAINLEIGSSTSTDAATSYIATPTAAVTVTTTGNSALVVDVTPSVSGDSVNLLGGCVRRLA